MSEFTVTEANEFPWDRALPALGEFLLRHIQRTEQARPASLPTSSVPQNPAPVTLHRGPASAEKWSKVP